MLGWLIDEHGIEPHVRVFDKSERTEGTFSQTDFTYDPEDYSYVCPSRKLHKLRLLFSALRIGVMKEAAVLYCQQARLHRPR